MSVDAAALQHAIERLRAASSICVLSGAGMSAESGIATFRDALSGLWARFDPAQLASPEGFRADPSLVWRWYAERRAAVRAAQPNAGHHALAAFAKRHPGRLTLVSQNVDDLHQRAGNVDTIRLHGDMLEDQWLDACPRAMSCDTAWAAPTVPPRCEACGNLVRPGVVWFGEALPFVALQAAEQAARSCQAMLVVGTSGVVWPAAGLAAQARRAGAFVIIVNPDASDIDGDAQLHLPDTAARLLPLLLDSL
ncbi:SIR2 family NAD-dependent protein deacylase [Aquabacterium sp.]|uniref:SIR2 family NAD-dependent protein deacylase n=1 Tax=Aquabacterium sp. TaxID=1872578 RepID=UPI002BF82F12|nr:NAD-dependent protein deacylase [Aquabacterium sp.]HSW05583.1 NAD-dependent protein deacylase [Aquabacterium sp.]